MDHLDTSSDEEETPSPPPQSAQIEIETVSIASSTVTSSTEPRLVEAEPFTSRNTPRTLVQSAMQALPLVHVPPTSRMTLPISVNLMALNTQSFATRQLEIVNEYYRRYPSLAQREWTDDDLCQTIATMLLLCASLMTIVRVVEWTLHHSPSSSRLQEVPRLWSYFTTSLQDIQQTLAEQEPSSSTRNMEPLPIANEPPRCGICLQNSPSIVFTPCGHMTCPICSNVLSKCPFCRGKIVRRFKAFF